MTSRCEEVICKNYDHQHSSNALCRVIQGLLTDGIAAPERENDILHGKCRWEQEPRGRVGLLQIDNLGARPARKVCCEFKVDSSATE